MWKTIKNTNGLYKIHPTGKVFSVKTNKLRNSFPDRYGYSRVNLRVADGSHKTMRVHRLVATHFIKGNPKLQVNHIDGDKSNHSIKNLAYVTGSDNMIHAHATGLYGRTVVKSHKRISKNKVSVVKQHNRK